MHPRSGNLRGVVTDDNLPEGFQLLSLPTELVLHVASFLAPRDAVALYRSSPELHILTTTLKSLAKHGKDLTFGPYTFTPLQFFISERVPHIVHYLLSHCGIKPNTRDLHDPLYPLASAILASNYRICILLLQYGAKAHTRLYHHTAHFSRIPAGESRPPARRLLGTPLDLALRMQSPNADIVKLLRYTAATRSAAAPYNHDNPPVLATVCATLPLRANILRYLLSTGADPNQPFHPTSTPLIEACRSISCTPAILAILLSAGADPNLRYNNTSPLLTLCVNPLATPESVTALIVAGADVNLSCTTGFAQDSQLRVDPLLSPPPLGATALHLAAQVGNEGVVRILLEAGADARARCARGASVLHSAMVGKSEGVVEMLMGVQGVSGDAVTGKGEEVAEWAVVDGSRVVVKEWLRRCEVWGIGGVEKARAILAAR